MDIKTSYSLNQIVYCVRVYGQFGDDVTVSRAKITKICASCYSPIEYTVQMENSMWKEELYEDNIFATWREALAFAAKCLEEADKKREMKNADQIHKLQ